MWDHYNYEKNRLRGTGILAGVVREEQEQINAVIQTEDDSNKLDYLKTNVEDWNTIEIYWKDTYPIRRHQLAVGISTHDYISNFLCLQSEKGEKLVSWNIFFIKK